MQPEKKSIINVIAEQQQLLGYINWYNIGETGVLVKQDRKEAEKYLKK